MQHWWLPHSGQGVRTRISDDRVWLAFATATYVASAGRHRDSGRSRCRSSKARPLRPGEHDAFFQPMIADESATLFEHCARGLDQCLDLTGEHGLPLIGTGDWNDGMNRVGEGGKGESVWLGWLLVRTIALFAPLAEDRDAGARGRWRDHAASVREALEREAWDGEWYRRATFDDGTWLGSKANEECRIDSIAQSWAVLSGAADPGARRNGDGVPGNASHPPRRRPGAAVHAALRRNATRSRLYQGLSAGPARKWRAIQPRRHVGDPRLCEAGRRATRPPSCSRWSIRSTMRARLSDVERYKVEPYVVAADVYSVSPHVGRGGWTWYTGSAGWMYRAGIEGILGIRREGAFLIVDPCIPAAWPGFEATVRLGATRYDIHVENPSGSGRGISRADP